MKWAEMGLALCVCGGTKEHLVLLASVLQCRGSLLLLFQL